MRWLRQWWLDRPLRIKGLLVVALPLVALMGTTSANLLLQQAEGHERTDSIKARNLAGAASQNLADAVNAETGVRGYVATRDPLFLAPYNLALTRIGAERRSLREAASIEGAGRQQRAVDASTGKMLSELAQLRSAADRGIPVGNLVLAGYRGGANSYVRKPISFSDFAQAVHAIGMFWLLLAESPPNSISPPQQPTGYAPATS